jgi:hypothetical protein
MSTMARWTFQAVGCLLFGFVPLTIAVHAINSASLPSSLIAHFGSSGTPVAWITKTGLLELHLGCVMLIALAGSATAYLTPKCWVPDFTSWFGLAALYGVMVLTVYSEKAVLAQKNPPFSDPVVDLAGLSAIAIALAWQLFGWTQS